MHQARVQSRNLALGINVDRSMQRDLIGSFLIFTVFQNKFLPAACAI
jgi:hypothetical protein